MFILHPQLDQDTAQIGDLALSKVLLMNDSQYPWLILVPRRINITEVYELDDTDREQLQLESHWISKLLMFHFHGHKLNTAALGNVVPQLHIHHIVRWHSDPAWPKPVWGTLAALPYSQTKLTKMITTLQNLITSSVLDFKAC